MAEIIKLGSNGNWGVKPNGVLAYNDENNIFKAIELQSSRASGATYVGEDGLIKDAEVGVPRIDWTNGVGALLLEPSRKNQVENSEYYNASSWTLNNVTITDNTAISPEGVQNASKWVAASGLSLKSIYPLLTSFIGVAYTATAYFKADEYPLAFIRLGGIGGDPYILYNLSTQSMVATSGLTSYDIESVGNEWYRVQATATATSTLVAPNYCFLPSSGYTLNVNNIPQYTGDGTSGGFLWGAQLEAGSYPTSYIPTSGATATRIAETCSKSGLENYIGQTEGTVFLESNNLHPSGTRTLGMLYTSGSAFYQIYLTSSNQVRVDVNGVLLLLSSSITVNTKNKIAFSYKSGENVLYINGNQVAVSSSTTIPSSLNSFYLGNFNGGEQSGSFTEAKVYNTRLSNAELQTLTTL